MHPKKFVQHSLYFILCLSLATPALGQLECSLTRATNTSASTGAAFISDDGSRFVFTSFADPTGGNPDGRQEIFLWDAGVITQISETPFAFTSDHPRISRDGTHVSFTSSSNPTGQNADGNLEIFLYDGVVVTQLTDTAAPAQNRLPNPDGDGSLVVFESSADLTGGNPDGNPEIFLYDGMAITQISSSPLRSGNPTINADGSRIAFESAGNLTGQNPDGSDEIFLWDGTDLTQITQGPAGTLSRSAAIDAAGIRITFTSNADLVGENPDGVSQLFLYDGMAIQQITRLTGAGSHPGFPVISGDGNTLGFSTPDDVQGPSDGNFEIFLYRDGVISQITRFRPPTTFAVASINFDGSLIGVGGFTNEARNEAYLGTCDRARDVVEVPTTGFEGSLLLILLLTLCGLGWVRRAP